MTSWWAAVGHAYEQVDPQINKVIEVPRAEYNH